jgi:hypothetical protein
MGLMGQALEHSETVAAPKWAHKTAHSWVKPASLPQSTIASKRLSKLRLKMYETAQTSVSLSNVSSVFMRAHKSEALLQTPQAANE